MKLFHYILCLLNLFIFKNLERILNRNQNSKKKLLTFKKNIKMCNIKKKNHVKEIIHKLELFINKTYLYTISKELIQSFKITAVLRKCILYKF